MHLHLVITLTQHFFLSQNIIVDNNILRIEYKRFHRNAPINSRFKVEENKVKADNAIDFEIQLMLVPKEDEVDRTLSQYQRDFGTHSNKSIVAHKQGEK